MADATAIPSPVIIDAQFATSGSTTISYSKDSLDELWERRNDSAWVELGKAELHRRTATGNEVFTGGSFPIPLKAGQWYELGVFRQNLGPNTTDPSSLATVKAYGIWKKPEARSLIGDRNLEWGGTWSRHQIFTNVPTNVLLIAVSQKEPVLDGDGIPRFASMEGNPKDPLRFEQNHIVELLPLLPGHKYFFAAVVVDDFGNWEVLQAVFETHRRRITVKFQTLHVYNDGDPFDVGEGEFWFRVYHGFENQPRVIEDFHLPEADIDDWGETDRPYQLGFSHIGTLQSVAKKDVRVSVASWAVEHDGFLESNEGAGGDVQLPLPAGKGKEQQSDQALLIHCDPTTVGDDFRYGVDVVWSVEYAP